MNELIDKTETRRFATRAEHTYQFCTAWYSHFLFYMRLIVVYKTDFKRCFLFRVVNATSTLLYLSLSFEFTIKDMFLILQLEYRLVSWDQMRRFEVFKRRMRENGIHFYRVLNNPMCIVISNQIVRTKIIRKNLKSNISNWTNLKLWDTKRSELWTWMSSLNHMETCPQSW